VAVITDVSEERIISIRVESICEQGDSSALVMETIHSSETSILTTVTRGHIPEEGMLHGHRCEDLKSYIVTGLTTVSGWTQYTNLLMHKQFGLFKVANVRTSVGKKEYT
jgi:hypothetical protein